VTFPPLPQPKLVLDLATPEGCKAELTWQLRFTFMFMSEHEREHEFTFAKNS